MDNKLLRDIFLRAPYMELVSGGYRAITRAGEPFHEATITDGHLRAFGHWCVPVFQYLRERTQKGGLTYFGMREVCGAIEYFNHPPVITLVGKYPNNEISLRHHIKAIYAATILDKSANVKIDIECYDMIVTPTGFSYGAGERRVVRFVNKPYLDDLVPGWLERYRLAETLDLSPRERALHTFTHVQPTQQVDISNITFGDPV